jgi:hypothetical protein
MDHLHPRTDAFGESSLSDPPRSTNQRHIANLNPPMSDLSLAIRVMAHPFRTYASIARGDEPMPAIRDGALKLLFVLASFVALTTTGRLAPIEIAVAMVSFIYVPIVHAASTTLALRALAKKASLRDAIALSYAGYGPWLLFFVIVSGLCLFVPSPAQTLFRVLPPLVLATFVWGIVVTYGSFRHGLELTRPRAIGATFIHYLTEIGFVVAYYVVAGALLPQVIPQ